MLTEKHHRCRHRYSTDKLFERRMKWKWQFLALLLMDLLPIQTLVLNMAILGYRKALLRGFASNSVKLPPSSKLPIENVDHLCLDVNEILHRVFDERHDISFRKLWAKLDSIVEAVNPKKSLVFAFDGPAPFAKLLLQRQRRSSSA